MINSRSAKFRKMVVNKNENSVTLFFCGVIRNIVEFYEAHAPKNYSIFFGAVLFFDQVIITKPDLKIFCFRNLNFAKS